MLCRSLADIDAAAAADALAEPVRSQEAMDAIAAILAPHLPQIQAQAA